MARTLQRRTEPVREALLVVVPVPLPLPEPPGGVSVANPRQAA